MDSNNSSSDSQLLDPSQLETFVMLGYEDYADLLADVTNDVPGYLATIRSAILSGDAAATSAAAHSCRGMLSYFGCVALTDRLGGIEHSPQRDPSSADSEHSELVALWDATRAAIIRWEQSVPDFAPGS